MCFDIAGAWNASSRASAISMLMLSKDLRRIELTDVYSRHETTLPGDNGLHLLVQFVTDTDDWTLLMQVTQAIGSKVTTMTSQGLQLDNRNVCEKELPKMWRLFPRLKHFVTDLYSVDLTFASAEDCHLISSLPESVKTISIDYTEFDSRHFYANGNHLVNLQEWLADFENCLLHYRGGGHYRILYCAQTNAETPDERTVTLETIHIVLAASRAFDSYEVVSY